MGLFDDILNSTARTSDCAEVSSRFQAYLREISELLPILRRYVGNELAAEGRADAVGVAAILAGMDFILEIEGPDRAAELLQELASMIRAGRLDTKAVN